MSDDCACDDGVIKIYQGEDRDLILLCKRAGGLPFNLTGASAAVATFPGTTAPVVKTLGSGVTITDAPAGQVTVTLGAGDTALLKISGRETFSLAVTIAGKVRIFKFLDALAVEAAT